MLIPNERGLQNALVSHGRFQEINVFLSASETHNRKNVNRSIRESLVGLERVLGHAREEGLRCEAVISVAFGCPYEGHVAPERVLDIAGRLVRARARRRSASATPPGWPTRVQVRAFFEQARAVLGDDVELTAHFHNTRGQGLANVLAALEVGVDSFESSFGELGGCPVPAGATGNIATEDLVSMLHEMGIETGIDLEALLEAARAARDVLGRPLGSHTLVAGAVDWHRGRRAVQPRQDRRATVRAWRPAGAAAPGRVDPAAGARRRCATAPCSSTSAPRASASATASCRAACSSRATCSSGAATRTARTATRAWPTPSRSVIVMCDAGFQSSLAAATLQELGHARATDLDGGFQAWRAAGLPVAPLDARRGA